MRNKYLLSEHLGFPGGSDSKESVGNVGDLGSIPRLGRFPGEGKGYSLQYSGLENSMDCKESDTIQQLSFSIKVLFDFSREKQCMYFILQLISNQQGGTLRSCKYIALHQTVPIHLVPFDNF